MSKDRLLLFTPSKQNMGFLPGGLTVYKSWSTMKKVNKQKIFTCSLFKVNPSRYQDLIPYDKMTNRCLQKVLNKGCPDVIPRGRSRGVCS